MPVACIVEGHGEVEALPVLLDRLSAWLLPEGYRAVARPPLRTRKDRFLNKDAEFDRFVGLAGSKAGAEGSVLILLDADDDRPAELGRDVLERARRLLPNLPVSVVIANREFEAWFLAAAASLDEPDAFESSRWTGDDPEAPRNAKGKLALCLGRSYREIQDQPAFASRMDLAAARLASRSFRKLCDDWTKLSG